VLPIADTDDAGRANDDAMIAAIRYAIRSSVRVISISQGEAFASPALANAVAAAQAADIVVVAAAGDRSQGDLTVDAPANLPGVIAVAAIDRDGNRLADSVTGPAVTLAAPGAAIASPAPGGGYSAGTGTSDATAIVAGAVALVRAKYPNLSAAEVIHRLTATATDKGPPGRDNEYGYGVINIVAALTADVPPLSASPHPAPSGVDQSPDRSSVAQPPSATSEGPSALLIVIPAVVFLCALVGILVWWAARRRTP
jgi:subtilisin family serine protease